MFYHDKLTMSLKLFPVLVLFTFSFVADGGAAILSFRFHFIFTLVLLHAPNHGNIILPVLKLYRTNG